VPATLAGCPSIQVGDQTVSFTSAGEDRTVLVHVPAVDAAAPRLPALIALHGYSAHAADLAASSGLSAKADTAGFVVAYPQALGDPPEWHLAGGWSNAPWLAESDRTLVGDVLHWLLASGCVDPARIFLAGHSQGGGMAGDVACELADRLAGVGLMSAMYMQLPCQPVEPIPVFARHAVDDPVLPYAGGHVQGSASYPSVLPVEDVIGRWAVADGCSGTPGRSKEADDVVRIAWKGCAAPVVLDQHATGGHDWPPAATDELWQFLSGLAPG
jgi:polyhydroxybutyrate depolymerase